MWPSLTAVHGQVVESQCHCLEHSGVGVLCLSQENQPDTVVQRKSGHTYIHMYIGKGWEI